MTQSQAKKVLGLATTDKDILVAKKNYKKLVSLWHPDVIGEKGKKTFLEIKEAYEFLCNFGLEEPSIMYTHSSLFNIIKK